MSLFQKRITLVLSLLLLISALLSFVIGKYNIDLNNIIHLCFAKLGIVNNSGVTEEQSVVLFDIRLPRVLLIAIVGSSLAISGAVLQSFFKNPLVSPFTLGVSSGAAFGSSIVVVFLSTPSVLFFQISAFCFGVIAVLIVIALSKLFSSSSNIILILSGMIVSAFFASMVSLFQYYSDEQKLQAILFWLFGSFSNSSWQNIEVVAPIYLLCCLIMLLLGWKINVISLGEEVSQTLGVNLKKMKVTLIVLTTILTSSVTAICGPIGWIGLIIPHLVRMLGGSNNLFVLPNSMILGAAFLLFVDLVARNIAQVEIPIGIVTSIIGLPFFIFILSKTKNN